MEVWSWSSQEWDMTDDGDHDDDNDYKGITRWAVEEESGQRPTSVGAGPDIV